MGVSLGINIVQNSQTIASNKSNITVSVIAYWTGGSWNKSSPAPSGWLKVDGTQYNFSSTFNEGKTSSGNKTLYTKTLDVEHDVQGVKNVVCSAYFATGVSSGNISASASKKLTDIPRFAKIISAPNFNDEDNPTITYENPAGNSITSLRACISLDGTDDDIAYRDISKTGTSYTFNLTTAERDVLRAATTDSNSRTVKFYIRSEIGSNYEGSNLIRTLTIKNPEPTINPTVVDTNSETIALTGNSNTIVRHYSEPMMTFNASAVKKATITSRNVSCGGGSYAGVGSVDSFTWMSKAPGQGPTSNNFEFVVTDSRKNVVTKTVTTPFVEYVKLTCSLSNNIPDTNGTLLVKATGNYYNGSFGAKNNSLKVYYRYKVYGGSYNSWTSMTISYGTNTYAATANITGLDYQSAYVVQTYAVDELATVYSVEKTVKATPVFDWGESDFKFNVPVYDEFGTVISNGLSEYTGSGSSAIDPNTTLESLILTDKNAPSAAFYYIHTMFYNSKSTTSNRAQLAIPYNADGAIYFRYYYSNKWSAWRKPYYGGELGTFSALELHTTLPYIDFHGNNYTGDYTHRIIAENTLLRIVDASGGGIDLKSKGTVRFYGEDSSNFIAVLKDRMRTSVNDSYYLGDSSWKWKAVYATNGTIQTSDRNQKTNIEPIDEKYIELFDKLQPVSFEFSDQESDRIHIGFISQDVKEAMDEVGLTDLDFAGYCRDVKKETIEIEDPETGDISYIEREMLDDNGDPAYLYSLRYSEFIALNSKMIQLNKQKIADQEKEIQQLRNELSALKDAVNKIINQ